MIYIISIALIAANAFFMFSKKNLPLLSISFFCFFWILLWGNTNNPDFWAYSTIYETNGVFTTNNLEWGFLFLVKLGNYMGLSYNFFLLIVSLVCYTIIFLTVKKYTSNFHLLYVFYFIFPFFMDVIQIRNFIIMSIFIYATRFLVENSRLKYILLISIACTFHLSAVAFFPFVLVTFKNKEILLKTIVISSTLLSAVTLINNKTVPFLNVIISAVSNEKVEDYFDSNTNLGFLLYWLLYFLSLSSIFISKKVYENFNKTNLKNNLKYSFIKVVYWINVVSSLYLPLYLMNSNFSRLLRNTIILNYIVMAIVIPTIRNSKEKAIYLILIIIYILAFSLSLLYPNWVQNIKPILENNIFF